MWEKIIGWFEVRIGLGELVKEGLDSCRVPKNVSIFQTIGCLAFAAFVIQVFTGFCLLLYYAPNSEQAFASVQSIMQDIPYGWLFRMMHVVGGTLLLITVALHMLSAFVMGSYKKPREMTWITGGLLFFAMVIFAFTGNLLPWGQLNYWQTTIVTAIPTAFPYVGEFITAVLRSGGQMSGLTLNKFFALHVSLLPFVFLALFVFHLFLVRRIGISSPPSFGDASGDRSPRTAYRKETYPDGHPVYPYFVVRVAFMVTVYLSVLFLLITFLPGLFLPEGSVIQANPLKTPVHVRPEWYLLAPYQMLKLIPNMFFALSVQLIMGVLFVFWPFFDAKKEGNMLLIKRPLLFGLSLSVMAVWFILTIWGKY